MIRRVPIIAAVLIACQTTAYARDLTNYPYENASRCSNIVADFCSSYKRFFETSIQLGLDDNFSDEQRDFVIRAVEAFLERSLSDRVLTCAFHNATRDMPNSRKEFETQLYLSLAPRLVGGVAVPAFLFIARYWDDPGYVGVGYMNLFYDTDMPMPGQKDRHYFHVAINSDYMEPKKYWAARDERYWAGVIGHEMLHNLGYDHPTGYPGSFIKVYGDCVASNGIYMALSEAMDGDHVVHRGQ